MARALLPSFQLVIQLAAILLQCFQSPVAALVVNPATIQHATNGVDAVKYSGLGDDLGLNAETAKRVYPRKAGGQLLVGNVVWKIVSPPDVILFFEHLGVMIEADARSFVIINQPALFADALNEPNCGASR